ncbi:MAG: electron transport complex subunit RsxE [Dehalococcoidales bacterium]|jgi:electron transport complex protein RnfE|nr:electron transport complex subunit RsxE [Dehalococcoidales bacterium]MDD5604545.1 electron transport complex subunit RsxE [Dehalococcoidales bacterium]MDX9985905.1 electron transport complex subunit RsxE [Dehalococcoidales bacterium]NLE90913.1 electron transport complex subunit RsxE [Dehalococcoidales bacterium]
MVSWLKEFGKGLVVSNPIFVMALGLCPSLAVTNSLDNAIGMGAAVIFVLLCSNILVSILRTWVAGIVRIPTFIVIIATFVTIISLIFQAYVPALYESLGIYLPLIVVNCIILGRAEAFASKNRLSLAVADALGMGSGFLLAICIIATLRETLGTGKLTIFGNTLFSLPVLSEQPISLFLLPAGAFLVIGLLLALFRRVGLIKND